MTLPQKIDLLRHVTRLSLIEARIAASKRRFDSDANRRVRKCVAEARATHREKLVLLARQAAR